MLKVILADDEVRICRLIQALADWKTLDMEVVATASNGVEALELIQQYQPDILITDIRMPGVNGLELIERAKELLPELEIVIISGYAHFGYAQVAIKFGVSDYLLKPIQQRELMETLNKLKERCAKRSSALSEMQQLQQSSRNDWRRLHDMLISDLLAPPPVEGEALSAALLQSRYHFTVQEGLLQVFILNFDYDPQSLSPQAVEIIHENADSLLKKELAELCAEMTVSFRPFRAYGVLNFPAKKKGDIRKAMRTCLNQLIGQRMLYENVAFSAALGTCVEGPEDLRLSCKNAEDAIAERLVEGAGQVFELNGSGRTNGLVSGPLLSKYQTMLDVTKETARLEEADAAVDFLKQAVEASSNVHGHEMIQLVVAAARIFLVQMSIAEVQEESRAFVQACERCRSADALFDQLRALQRTWLTRIAEQRKNDAIRPIRIAKQYVLQHYAEPITLEKICDVSGFSASYFSVLFKKETGEGFTKYLTRVRMDRAKELLQETNKPVSEICRLVGYNDLRHFTQTFKKMTDLSPGQYRKLYG